MDPFHFACPHCSSRLRIREKLLVGRQIDCPECSQTLLIVEQKGELDVRPVERKVARPANEILEKHAGKLSAKNNLPGQPAPTAAAGLFGEGPPAASTVVPGPDGSTPADAAHASSTAGAESVISSRACELQRSVPSRGRSKILTACVLGLALGLIAIAFYARSSGTNSGDGPPGDKAVAAVDLPLDKDAGNDPIDAAQPVAATAQQASGQLCLQISSLTRTQGDEVSSSVAPNKGRSQMFLVSP
jgi:DNA-directed RNA polymerase subunit RPC12/RpoP